MYCMSNLISVDYLLMYKMRIVKSYVLDWGKKPQQKLVFFVREQVCVSENIMAS